MTQHTPGPWQALENIANHGRVVARGHWIADTTAADAPIIAAVPDLLAALQRFLNISEHPLVNWPTAIPIADVQNEARAAIAKATEGQS